MGITNIFNLIKKKCPDAIKQKKAIDYKCKVITIDASIVIYQFLIATQTVNNRSITLLKDADGNLTSHLMGILQRNIFFLKNGIKPLWVFDGVSPQQKSKTIQKRIELKNLNKKNIKKSIEDGDIQKHQKYSKRSVFITKYMKKDAINLLDLIGIPYVEVNLYLKLKAPEEGEAQCSILAKNGDAYGVATEDLDSLAFGSPFLLRNFNIKNDITEINLKTTLDKLNVSHEQFVDICILCGCDYCGTISSIGPFNAYNLIKKYSNIEGVLDYISKEKKEKYLYNPENFNYEETRKIFLSPNVLSKKDININWIKRPNYEALKDFLCGEKNCQATRIDSYIEKLKNL